MKNKNWNLVFGVNYYNSVLIKDDSINSSLNLLYQSNDIFTNLENFSLLINDFKNKNNQDKNYIIKTFAPKLKDFMSDKNKNVLLITEQIFNSLIKEDKRNSFFKFLYKNNKKIVVFYEEESFLNYFNNIDNNYALLNLTQEEWFSYFGMFDSFNEVKVFMLKILNPFANPNLVFKKYKEYF